MRSSSANSSKSSAALSQFEAALGFNIESALAVGSQSVPRNQYVDIMRLIAMMLLPVAQSQPVTPEAFMASAMVQVLLEQEGFEKSAAAATQKQFTEFLSSWAKYYAELNAQKRDQLVRQAHIAAEALINEHTPFSEAFLKLRFLLLRAKIIEALLALNLTNQPINLVLNGQPVVFNGLQFVPNPVNGQLRLQAEMQRVSEPGQPVVPVTADARIEHDKDYNPILILAPTPIPHESPEYHENVGLLGVAAAHHLKHAITKPESILSQVGLAIDIHETHFLHFKATAVAALAGLFMLHKHADAMLGHAHAILDNMHMSKTPVLSQREAYVWLPAHEKNATHPLFGARGHDEPGGGYDMTGALHMHPRFPGRH